MTVTQEITTLITQYRDIGLDANKFNELIELRKLLVVLSYKLGMTVAKYKRDYDNAYARRKIAYFNHKMQASETENMSKAETIAETQVADLRQAEKELEGLYNGSRLILNQTNEALKSMHQDISILRTELTE